MTMTAREQESACAVSLLERLHGRALPGSSHCRQGVSGADHRVRPAVLCTASTTVLHRSANALDAEVESKLDGASAIGGQHKPAVFQDSDGRSSCAECAECCADGTCRSLYWHVGKHLDSLSATNVSAVLFMIAVTPGFSATTYVPSLVLERLLFYRCASDARFSTCLLAESACCISLVSAGTAS